jgi:type IV pilus assembly protein PilM
MFGRSSKTLVGLDVGSFSVKAVELKKNASGLRVVHMGAAALPAADPADATERGAQVGEAIAKLLEGCQINGNGIASSVSGHSVIVKNIVLPVMSEEQLSQTIQQEAAPHLPFDLSEVNLDYQILGELPDGKSMDVLLVAVRKEKVEGAIKPIAQAGRNLRVLDVDSLALGNCYEFNYQPHAGDVVALLNLGANALNINIMKGDLPLFPRDVAVGGHLYSDALCRELGVSAEEAEMLKSGADAGAVSLEKAEPILQHVTEIILLEIHKTFDFFRASEAAATIERIYLSGGSAPVPGLLESLGKEFSMPVEPLDPFLKVSLPKEMAEANTNPPQMAVAVGLALRSFGQS